MAFVLSSSTSAWVRGLPATTTSVTCARRFLQSARPTVRAPNRFATSMAASSLHDVKFSNIDGNKVDFSNYKGKVVLGMNTASECGYTKTGYGILKNVAEKYGDKVVSVAFPSNEFGEQEPGSPDEIKTFVSEKFGNPDILIMEKSSVKGPTANEVFSMVKNAGMGEPNWNFDARLLFDKDGKLVQRFDNNSSEDDITSAIEKLL